MSRTKTLQELTIKDNFMFGAVMSDPDNCRRLLELILKFPIARVEVHCETSIKYHPEYRGIRLDVYAKDAANTRYNVEMQALSVTALGKRSRYYHSQIDMEMLKSGSNYDELPDSYVIFICDFDPFKRKRYRYTFENRCLEEGRVNLFDRSQTIFLSTMGENEQEVPKELVNFLNYIHADLEQSTADFGDDFVKKLQMDVENVKRSKEREAEYMSLELYLYDRCKIAKNEGISLGKAEGFAQGKVSMILGLLRELGTVSEELSSKIYEETDSETLLRWAKLAVKAENLKQFEEQM